MARRRTSQGSTDPAEAALQAAIAGVLAHPLLRPLARATQFRADTTGRGCPPGGWAVATSTGSILLNGDRRASSAEWEWVIAHCLLHMAFGHLDESHRHGFSPGAGLAERRGGYPLAWVTAACLAVRSFQAGVGIGTAPADLAGPTAYDDRARRSGAEAVLAAEFDRRGVPDSLRHIGVGGPGGDLVAPHFRHPSNTAAFAREFHAGLSAALSQAVAVAGAAATSMSDHPGAGTAWKQAVDWVVTHVPLLGGLAAGLQVVDDEQTCAAESVSIAAVSPAAGLLYLNPRFAGTVEERRFVVAHELLHAGLRHDTRADGRDPYTFNVAADYVINGWLVEMGVGSLPDGCLHDPGLAGRSAEEVYDLICNDLRRLRKIASLRGIGVGDVLPTPPGGPVDRAGAVDLDEFYRRALADGAATHSSAGRGLLPAGLAEAIAAAAEAPPPWDVALARWFEERFSPFERRRSYARPSRRQASTPGIPRPSWVVPEDTRDGRVFGVVLDTSGSMGTRLLAHALGAVAAYAAARDVTAVRVVFCDAVAYDAGWMDPADIAGTVTVRGRGGTVLQPGVDLLEGDRDFPPDGPVLLITDGWCDHVRVRRDHAWLIPAGRNLPFPPRGPVFRMGRGG